MLIGYENTVYKGKSLHVHRNNKNHILESQNGKHTHCFLIHLNKLFLKKNIKKHTNPWPKGQKPFFSKNIAFLTPKGRSPIFGPFLKFGQAIVDAIFVHKVSLVQRF
jgi:hypothetical protein